MNDNLNNQIQTAQPVQQQPGSSIPQAIPGQQIQPPGSNLGGVMPQGQYQNTNANLPGQAAEGGYQKDVNVNNTAATNPAVQPDGTKAGAKKEEDLQTGTKNNEVTKRDVENVVASWTGIPISKLTEDESAKLQELEKRIHKRLIDQEEAVVKVSEAVRRGRIGLASGQRPIASF